MEQQTCSTFGINLRLINLLGREEEEKKHIPEQQADSGCLLLGILVVFNTDI